MTETFNFSPKLKKLTLALMVLGLIGIVIGFTLYDCGGVARVWSNLLLNSYYFLGIGLAALFFLATHQIGYSGWHTLVKRIPEAMSSIIPIAGLVILLIGVGNYFHWHHIYHWTDGFIHQEQVSVGDLRNYENDIAAHSCHGDAHGEDHTNQASHEEGAHVAPEKPTKHYTEEELAFQGGYDYVEGLEYATTHQSLGHHLYADEYANAEATALIENPHYDKIIAGKAPFLNNAMYIGLSILFIGLWTLIGLMFKKSSAKEDQIGGLSQYQKGKYIAAAFIVVFAVGSSVMSWMWIMSIDTHWYSTLFGWYNLSSYLVASIAIIILLIIYLKSKGYLEVVNNNHVHDLGKYMFGFSVFWAYLFFSQFLLIWYANIPEATHYYHNRFDVPLYKGVFFVLLLINFVAPFLLLMTRKSKRNLETMGFVAVLLVVGHWLDFYWMIMPASTGTEGSIGFIEILIFAGFVGLFMFTTFNALTKSALLPVNNPYLKESTKHHI